ncbi:MULTISPECIES: AAA family ATPase [Micromonospora]|uniref:ATP-dependent DNA helicase n=1 Tax=Micromonospora solifontis TaxID=2487138 RepID=A0ABX9WAU0_9ACTN|nr:MULTISPECIES: AAA family ATPase [Micromonospora]NES13914.1 AAA family ATPase [Micromonospora sp. PPF5-17B]NES38812.1 AAA family ATPase [Micromonospora solifontis]NES54014.1 AAA family ATPase [Micromonospora sp. PPF5-6]RNL93076.1 ATP-dependent DNA helicase [Micromonospora solifontis]
MSDQTTLDREIAVEQRHLDRVYARLAELRRAAAEAEREGYRLARVGNFGALVERDAMVFHAAQRRYVLDAEHEGLVFGRLDLRTGQVLHVGRLGVRGENAETLVVDWRAPAAAAFYQATPAEPMGVVRRRTIQSSAEKVTRIEDDLLDPESAPPDLTVVGDGALLATLSRATGRGMRDIVATIQREQDEAIRSPGTGVTIVSGGPGTGKTAVALHRAAYLLYSDRARYAGGGILVVGPSGVFVEYIASVLPSLGEETATLHSLGSLFPGMSATRTDPPEVAAVKGSLRMRRVLERAVRDAVPDAPTELRLLYRGELLRLERAELEAIRDRALPRGARRNEVRRAGFDGVLAALYAQARTLRVGRLPEQPAFEDEIIERSEFREFLKAWWPRLHPRHVLGWLAHPERLRRYAAGVLSGAEIRLLTEAYRSLDPEGLTIADVALLDELDALLGKPVQRRRPRRDPFQLAGGVRELSTYADRQRAARAAARERPEDYRDYAHVVVDESQDVSPMQWRMIGRRGRLASWTVVGDPAQTAWTGDPQELTRARDQALGRRRRYRYELTTNYRNSAEIFAVAAAEIRRLYPELPLPTAVRSTGVEPVELAVPAAELAPATVAAVRTLLAEVEGTVGVITPVPRRDEVAGWLGDLGDGRLQVVTSLQAKGMEYDGVALVAPSEIRADPGSGVRTLYVALSRATQRLTTLDPVD